MLTMYQMGEKAMKDITEKYYREKAAFFAHEIKNPLAVIRANVQLIELDNKGENKKSFDAVYSEIEKINKLINENIEQTKKEKNQDKTDKANAVEIVAAIFDKYSRLYDRRFEVENNCENTLVNVKDELLESLFNNIVKNAVEATENGDTIKAEIKKRYNKISINISDTGCGISDEDIVRIGDLFYTTKNGGNGVGLFMCKRITEKNGGRFKVSHNKPKGTIVTVELNTK